MNFFFPHFHQLVSISVIDSRKGSYWSPFLFRRNYHSRAFPPEICLQNWKAPQSEMLHKYPAGDCCCAKGLNRSSGQEKMGRKQVLAVFCAFWSLSPKQISVSEQMSRGRFLTPAAEEQPVWIFWQSASQELAGTRQGLSPRGNKPQLAPSSCSVLSAGSRHHHIFMVFLKISGFRDNVSFF